MYKGFIIKKLKNGKHYNIWNDSVLFKKSNNNFIFKKNETLKKGWKWCGFEIFPKNTKSMSNVLVNFNIKFNSDVPKINSGFYLKSHCPIQYYDEWLLNCKKGKFTNIKLLVNIKNVKQLFCFICDQMINKSKIDFEINNLSYLIDSKCTPPNYSLLKNKEKETIHILVKGYLYKNKYTPYSNAKNNYKNYVIDFFKLEKMYEKLFNELKNIYNLKITFITYSNTPKPYLDFIRNKNWNTYLIPEKKSKQFTGTIKYLDLVRNNCLIIRSDLIIKNNLIELLKKNNFNDKITCLNKEAKCFYNDTVIIVPFCYVNDMKNNLKSKYNRNGFWCHLYNNNLPIKIIDKNNKGGPQIFKTYVEIYRGT